MPPRLRNCLNRDKGKGVRQWTGSETSELIANIKRQLKRHDPLPYSKRIDALNWEEISIPCRSVNECRSRLDVFVKKIHKTRTLAEVLSAVENVHTADEDKKLPVNLPICDEMKRSNLVIEPVDINNNNLHPTNCFKRKSKRLSNNTPKRSNMTPFKLYAECNHSEDVNKATLKGRYSRLTDSENMIWIREAIDSASKGQDVKNILTENERNLLSKEPILGKGNVVRDKENNFPNVPKRKRKFGENDATIGSMNRKIRIFGASHFDISSLIDVKMQKPKTIETKPVAEEIMAGNEDTGCLIEVPKLEEKKSLENDVTEIGPAINGDDDVVVMEEETVIQTIDEQLDHTDVPIDMNVTLIETDGTDGAREPVARPIIKSTANDSQSSLANNCSAKASIKPEQPIKFEKPDLKQESRNPTTPVTRIKQFCNGVLGRIGSWVKRN